jgi:DNA-binding NarL/FixJ family response regulator
MFALALRGAGRLAEARHWGDQALTAARAVGSAEEEADALTTLAILEEAQGRAEAAFALYAEARRRAADASNAGVELRAISQLATAMGMHGNPQAALALLDEGIELATRAGLAWSWEGVRLRGHQCFAHYLLGDWDESERLAATVDVAVTTQVQAGLSATVLGVEVGRGHQRAAERLEWIRMVGGADLSIMHAVAEYAAELACWQGDLDAARADNEAALQAYRPFRSPAAFPVIELCARGLAAEADRAERARAAAADAELAQARSIGLALLEEARAAAGAVPGFGELADLKATFTKMEAEWTRLEGRSDPARSRAAVDAFSFGFVYEVACCQWRLAQALLGVGKREEAAETARAAYQTAVRLGARPLRAALEALTRRARLDLGAGAPQAPRAAGLTPRELEVLRLLTAGRSNRQISEQLFISAKTASVHVTNILAKLGVHSRLEAAARGRDLGLDPRVDPSASANQISRLEGAP